MRDLVVFGNFSGHAVRTASVAAAIKQLNPDIELVFVTTAPKWLLQSYVKNDFIYRAWGEAFAEIVTWIEDCYGKCDRLFRLPLAESEIFLQGIRDYSQHQIINAEDFFQRNCDFLTSKSGSLQNYN